MTLSATPKVDAVIVSCNSAGDLTTLFGCARLHVEFDRFVVVDNGSRDRSCEISLNAGATVLQRKTTQGYGAAANLGAAATTGPIFALVNPDITFTDRSMLTTLLEAFDDPTVALVAPALRLPDHSIQDSARPVPTPVDLVVRRRVGPPPGTLTERCEVPWVTGAFVLVRRCAFDALGGFDERFPLYFEDVDLCVRAWRDGWKVVYQPAVVAEHHHHAASRQSTFSRATRRHLLSALRFYLKHPHHITDRAVARRP